MMPSSRRGALAPGVTLARTLRRLDRRRDVALVDVRADSSERRNLSALRDIIGRATDALPAAEVRLRVAAISRERRRPAPVGSVGHAVDCALDAVLRPSDAPSRPCVGGDAHSCALEAAMAGTPPSPECGRDGAALVLGHCGALLLDDDEARAAAGGGEDGVVAASACACSRAPRPARIVILRHPASPNGTHVIFARAADATTATSAPVTLCANAWRALGAAIACDEAERRCGGVAAKTPDGVGDDDPEKIKVPKLSKWQWVAIGGAVLVVLAMIGFAISRKSASNVATPLAAPAIAAVTATPAAAAIATPAAAIATPPVAVATIDPNAGLSWGTTTTTTTVKRER